VFCVASPKKEEKEEKKKRKGIIDHLYFVLAFPHKGEEGRNLKMLVPFRMAQKSPGHPRNPRKKKKGARIKSFGAPFPHRFQKEK